MVVTSEALKLQTTPCPKKTIPDIIDCNSKKDDPILIVLVQVFLTQLPMK